MGAASHYIWYLASPPQVFYTTYPEFNADYRKGG